MSSNGLVLATVALLSDTGILATNPRSRTVTTHRLGLLPLVLTWLKVLHEREA